MEVCSPSRLIVIEDLDLDLAARGRLKTVQNPFRSLNRFFFFLFSLGTRSPFVIAEPMIFVEDETDFPRDHFRS